MVSPLILHAILFYAATPVFAESSPADGDSAGSFDESSAVALADAERPSGEAAADDSAGASAAAAGAEAMRERFRNLGPDERRAMWEQLRARVGMAAGRTAPSGIRNRMSLAHPPKAAPMAITIDLTRCTARAGMAIQGISHTEASSRITATRIAISPTIIITVPATTHLPTPGAMVTAAHRTANSRIAAITGTEATGIIMAHNNSPMAAITATGTTGIMVRNKVHTSSRATGTTGTGATSIMVRTSSPMATG